MPLLMLLTEVGKVCGLAVSFLWLLVSRHSTAQGLPGSVVWIFSVMSLHKKKSPSNAVSLIFQQVSDSYFFCRGVKSGNEQFSRDITAWTFQESLVLRIDRTEHHRVNATESLEQYTTNDQLVSFVLVPP